MMIIQGIIELGYNIRSAWFLDIRISTCYCLLCNNFNTGTSALPDMGITLFTLIYDPINGKLDIIVLYQAHDNTYAQISAHAGCFLERLRLYL